MTKIPILYWPAVGLVLLWFIDLFFLRISSIDTLEALTKLIVPFTMLSAYLLQAIHKSGENLIPLSKRALVLRVITSLSLTVLTLSAWPRSFGHYVYQEEVRYLQDTLFKRRVESLLLSDLRSFPRGEFEIQNLPEEIITLMGLQLFISRNEGVDSWGHPYMYVLEKKGDGLWVGVYSKGRDGISKSKGNDPDDLNSWGQQGEYYRQQYIRQGILELLGLGAITFLFYLPVCLGSFRAGSPA